MTDLELLAEGHAALLVKRVAAGRSSAPESSAASRMVNAGCGLTAPAVSPAAALVESEKWASKNGPRFRPTARAHEPSAWLGRHHGGKPCLPSAYMIQEVLAFPLVEVRVV